MDFHFEVLHKNNRQTLEILDRLSSISKFYLAGGTALALHLGHRRSIDFDFFARRIFDESGLIDELGTSARFRLEKKSPQSAIGMLNDTKISFLGYPYPLLSPPRKIKNIRVAGVMDIACMKIDAIASRGTKRDFIDLYCVAKNIMPLTIILKNYKAKYAALNINMLHIKKSLVYFADAERDPMPHMITPIIWSDVKTFFLQELIRLDR